MAPSLVRISLFFLATLAVGGCSRAGGCPDGKTCLRYMAWGNPEQLGVEQQMVDAFNSKNPDLHVKLFKVPGSSYGVKMTTMLVSGTAPDVLRVDHYNFPSFQKKGYFRDLTELAANDTGFKREDFYPATLQEGTVDGRLYGLNVLFGGILIYYNKTLFQKAGLDDPYELSKRGEWTWDRFRESAVKLTQMEDGKPKVYGTNVPGFPTSVPAVYGFGGRLLNDDLTKAKVSSPETVKAYQFLSDLIWKDHAAPTPAEGANSAFSFESGKLGMTFDWMGMTPRYREAAKGFEWDVCPVPGDATIVKGNQLVMAASSRHPEAAWRFMRFLTGVETENNLYAVIRRSFPTRKAVAESDDFLKTTQSPFNTRAFITSIEKGKPLPINDRWSEWTQALTSELDNLMSGRERDAKAVLTRANAKIDTILSEAPGY
ncbi:MAG TPA: sugar ABC transporter substrate-binding protein [Roseimicrobium sp.]|nr:sugar ABC transporter substrate-binding protein [Roseimicrobium sp.]